jgi:hypothetical protein
MRARHRQSASVHLTIAVCVCGVASRRCMQGARVISAVRTTTPRTWGLSAPNGRLRTPTAKRRSGSYAVQSGLCERLVYVLHAALGSAKSCHDLKT